jgi:hypothetical protein
MNNRTLELLAVSAAIETLESLAADGLLPEKEERSVYLIAAHLLSAFGWRSKHERAANNNVPPLDSPEAHLAYVHARLNPEAGELFGDYSYDEILSIIGMQMGATL